MHTQTELHQAGKTKLNALCCSANSDAIKAHLTKTPMDVNYDQGTPLILAIRSMQVYPSPPKEKCLDTLKALVDAGADVHINEDAPLYWAMKVDNHTAVEFLVSLKTTFSIEAAKVEEYIYRNPNLDKNLVTLLENTKAPCGSSMKF